MLPRTLAIFALCLYATQAFTTLPTAPRTRASIQLFEQEEITAESSPAESSPAEEISTYVRCGKCQTCYPMTEADLGLKGRGRRLECSVCSHSWFQSKDRLMDLRDGFEIVPMPEQDLERISTNIKEGKSPKFMGDIKLYVGNISFTCHEDDLYEIFSQAGQVGEVSLVRDDEGKNRGFGFVTMRTKEGGQKAIDELDGTPVRGRNIAVRESNN